MNKTNAHLYLPLVQALAEGRTICKKVDGRIIELIDFCMIEDADKYFIKPEPKTAWYRVAETTYGPTTVNNSHDEQIIAHQGFKRWLTERVTYEVTE